MPGTLASITGLDQETVENKLKPLPFIVIPPNSSHVTFVSEAFRKHAVARLSRLRSEVEEAIINEMLKNPDSERTRELLPGYLYKVGKFDHLLNFLTPEYLDLMLQRSQSMAPVKQKVELGVQASVQLHRDSDLVRFSIHGSALMQFDSADAWKSEIEARIALDDFQTAIALAQSAPLKEDRLHLLAVVAKGRRKRGMTPEPELVDNIRLLYDQIDTSRLGRRAYEIASDLVYTDHDLAVRLIEGARETDPEEVDLEIATLAVNSRKLASIEEGDAAEKIRSRIRSPQLRQFSQELMLMVQDYTAREVLAEVKKPGNASRKLFYLRRWTLRNRRNHEALKVIEEALGIAIAATEYTPNARDMRELASPLPFVVERASAERIIRMFDAQKGSIEHYGPSIDYVRLQLLIARCEYRYDLQKSRARFEDAYLYILDISDLSVRAECLARLLSALVRTDESTRLESVAELHIQVERELKSAVAELLDATALHDEVFEGIIRALSVGCLDLAVEIARSLNTEPRRDGGLLEAIGGAAGSEKRVRLDQLYPLITSIIDPETRSQAVLSVLQSEESRGGFDEATAAELLPCLQLIENMDNVEDKIHAYSTLYQILAGVESMRFQRIRGHIAEKLKDCLGAVDEGWARVRLAFEIVAALAPHSVSEASDFLKMAEGAKEENLLQTQDIARAYIGTVLLAISAYSGLLPRRLATDEDTRKLIELIDQIPSEGQRAWVWAELALRAHAKDEAALCKDVVATRIRPLLQSLAEMNLQHSREIVVLVAPALYCANPINARRDFDELPLHLRDYAILRTCLFMMRRHTLHEPYEHSLGQGYDLSYDQILELCELISMVDRDQLVFGCIQDIADSMVLRRDRFSHQQQTVIVSRLESITKSKFPNPRYIQHEGYRICAEAQIVRIRKPDVKTWLDLAERARALPNSSDRVYVICVIALACASKDRIRAKQLLIEARQLCDSIPSVYDRVDRLSLLSKASWEIDRSLARELLKCGIQLSLTTESPDLRRAQRSMLDFAYKVDPDLATSLVDISDTDPARVRARVELGERLELLKTAKQIADQPKNKTSEDLDESHYPRAAGMLWGSLNAGRIGHRPPEAMRDYLQAASSIPSSESYPIAAWTVANSISRFAKTDQAGRFLLPLFRSTVLASQIAARTANLSRRVLRSAVHSSWSEQGHGERVIIKAGQREEALRRVREWIEETAQEYLKICDPFFGPEDLEILQVILSVKPTLFVQILTSLKHHENLPTPLDETYRNHWRTRLSDQDPPDTEIVIVGTKSKHELPIHDRWWLTKGAGLRMGTSFHSLGVGRDSELSSLTSEDTLAFEREVDRYLTRSQRDHQGERMLYSAFTL